VEQSRAMPSNDPAEGDYHPPVSRTTCNQSPCQTFTSHSVTHNTANNNIGPQPSTHYDDDVDDDFDVAVMNVDLDIFEDNIDLKEDHKNHANQEEKSHYHDTSPSNTMSAHSLSSVEIKSIGEILTIVNDNSFHRTLHTKVL